MIVQPSNSRPRAQLQQEHPGFSSAFVVSDLHLGSPYCHHRPFLDWLASLPPAVPLILNGDIIDDPRDPLGPEHQGVLQRLIDESLRRPLIWVHGNHDETLNLAHTGQIRFARHWAIGRRLLIVHGDDLDEVMPRHRLFKVVFKALHRLRIKLGCPDVHVAQYAKRWGLLYRVLNRHVANKALRAARIHGFHAVTCGHTHAAMDLREGEARYLNTGAWTEAPHHFIAVTPEEIRLCVYPDGVS
ncbi:MAG: metallophosphoesterase [Candidatus Handelsmanbacteria bacterium]|nr:metallophosphoesterase [Candidatus Handelsmanbacteria bacterium]